MSEIKALEDMRNTVKTIAADCDEGWILGCLDAIEAEVAERFMELPLDADGVPIRVGDVMTLRHGKSCEVVAVSETQFTGKKLGSENCVCHANLHRHVKPRTVEDVLREFTEKYQYCISDNGRSITLAKYADEIRELLEVDA